MQIREAQHHPDILYSDTGCLDEEFVYFRSCLDCPLKLCKYDDPEGARLYGRNLKDMEVIRLLLVDQLTAAEVAQRQGVNVRTVFRVVKRIREQLAPTPGGRPRRVFDG